MSLPVHVIQIRTGIVGGGALRMREIPIVVLVQPILQPVEMSPELTDEIEGVPKKMR
jgi:hypothetical protein